LVEFPPVRPDGLSSVQAAFFANGSANAPAASGRDENGRGGKRIKAKEIASQNENMEDYLGL
jgi:hypothetical protein